MTRFALVFALAVGAFAQTYPTCGTPRVPGCKPACTPFQTVGCNEPDGTYVPIPTVSSPVPTLAPTYPPLVEPPFYAELVGPSGPLFGTNLCVHPCMVTLLADALKFMSAITPALTAQGGPFPGAKLQLIQEFGNDQIPTQQSCGTCFIYQPGDPDDLRRVFVVGTTSGQLVWGSPVEWGIETQSAAGVGSPGQWQWAQPYPQSDPTLHTLVWVAN